MQGWAAATVGSEAATRVAWMGLEVAARAALGWVAARADSEAAMKVMGGWAAAWVGSEAVVSAAGGWAMAWAGLKAVVRAGVGWAATWMGLDVAVMAAGGWEVVVAAAAAADSLALEAAPLILHDPVDSHPVDRGLMLFTKRARTTKDPDSDAISCAVVPTRLAFAALPE